MNNSRTLRVVILGCGAVSELYYAPALKELEKINLLQVKALFDPNPNRVAQIKKFFPSAIHLSDLAELCKTDLELAIIASPPRYHSEQTIQALQSGLSVLCEKPMATSSVEAEAMIEAASTAKRLLAVGLFRRFFPATKAIHEILLSNTLGDISSFYFSEGGVFRWPTQSASFFQKAASQGGVLMDIGVRLFDLLILWFGYPAEILYEDDAMGGIEANCRIRLKFSQGFSGEVRLSRDCPLPNRYIIQCKKGWIGWDVNEADKIQMGFYNSRFALSSQLHENKYKNKTPTLGQQSHNFHQSFTNQIRNVVAAIYGTEQLFIPSEQGLPSLRLIEYCYRHRTLMPMPWLSEREFSRARQINNNQS